MRKRGWWLGFWGMEKKTGALMGWAPHSQHDSKKEGAMRETLGVSYLWSTQPISEWVSPLSQTFKKIQVGFFQSGST